MTVMVTLRNKAHTKRRKYKTYKSAVKGIKFWLEKNEGLAMLYQPGKVPVVYDCHSKLPDPVAKKETNFYRTRAWRELRLELLTESDAACTICQRTRAHDIVLHVDHIKPRSKYPELALNRDNLQVLCEDCNIAKSDNELAIK